MVIIATLNVHEWSNSSGDCTIDEIITLIITSNIDIIGLQETSKQSLMTVANKLHNFNYIYNRKTAIFSKYPIDRNIPQKTTSERYISGIVTLPNNKTINIICVHLDYKHEPIRIKQMKTIMKNRNINNTSLILLGDFNALTKNDYSNYEWDRISSIRKSNKWEQPVDELTTQITSPDYWKLFDSKYITNNVYGPLHTCRFDTRIDYIYVNKKFINEWNITKMKHIVAMPSATDHNLVLIEFK